jgi:hypothetical protein
MEIKQAVSEHVMDLFEVVKCSTPVYIENLAIFVLNESQAPQHN